MNAAMGITLSVSAALALVFIVIRVKKGGVAGLISKTIASLAFFFTGVILACVNFSGNPIVQFLILLGLLSGVAGDVFLDCRQVDLERQGKHLNKGMLSFGVGHAFYLTAIVIYAMEYIDPTIPALSALIAIPVSAAVMFVMVKVLKMDVKHFVLQSFGYFLILLYVALLTFSIALYGGVPQIALLTVGAFLFLASDIILSFQLFGGQEKNKPLTVAVHIFYYAAQLIYASMLALL